MHTPPRTQTWNQLTKSQTTVSPNQITILGFNWYYLFKSELK